MKPIQVTSQYISPFDIDHPAPNVSKRYRFVSTKSILDELSTQGFVVTALSGTGTYGKHYARLTHPQFTPIDVNGHMLRPEVTISNGHNGQVALRVTAGFYVSACSNGLIFGVGFGSTLYHTGEVQRDVTESLPRIYQLVASASERVKDWSGRVVSEWDERVLISRAAKLRFSESKLASDSTIVDQLFPQWTKASYRTDGQRDLFSIYNKLQGHIVKGGAVVTINSEPTKLRKLSGASSTLSVNKRLFDICDEFSRRVG